MSEIDGHVSRNLAPENSVEAKFPEGLRVLAVDDNVVCLKLLAALLKKCRYKVTMTIKATEALEMLRKNKDSYDIVITDVKMLDMDGFELLEIIGLEMDIPVIMMSANDDTESVIKGVMHGARDYLLKPVRLEELKNIWQHVVRKNLFDPIKPSTAKVGTEQNQIPLKRQRNMSKEKEDETNTQSDDGESSAQKKHRVAWNRELHRKFLDAVQLLGVDKAVPKKILEMMNEPELSREHVASHLQKYRNLLKKEKKKDNMSQESESNVNSNQAKRHLPNTTIVTSDDQGLNTINFQNRSAEPGVSNVGITSLGNRFQTYGASPSSSRSLFYTMNRQDMLLQRDLLPPQMADQMRPNMPIPVLGSVPPTQILVPNPCPQPELNGTKFHAIHSRNKMVDDYVEMYSQVPSFGAGQPGPMPVSFVPYPCSPGAFNLGAPFQMLGDASTQLAPISQSDSLAMLAPSSFHGQHEGRNLVNLNGRGETNSFPFDKRGQSIDLSIRNGWFVQTISENLERESNGHYNSCSSPDDDLSVMVKQFSNNSAPRL